MLTLPPPWLSLHHFLLEVLVSLSPPSLSLLWLIFYPSSKCWCTLWYCLPCSSFLNPLHLKALLQASVATSMPMTSNLQFQLISCKGSSSNILTTYWTSPLACPIGASTSAHPFIILPSKSSLLLCCCVREIASHCCPPSPTPKFFKSLPLSLSL